MTPTFDPKGDVNQLAHVSLCLFQTPATSKRHSRSQICPSASQICDPEVCRFLSPNKYYGRKEKELILGSGVFKGFVEKYRIMPASSLKVARFPTSDKRALILANTTSTREQELIRVVFKLRE